FVIKDYRLRHAAVGLVVYPAISALVSRRTDEIRVAELPGGVKPERIDPAQVHRLAAEWLIGPSLSCSAIVAVEVDERFAHAAVAVEAVGIVAQLLARQPVQVGF